MQIHRDEYTVEADGLSTRRLFWLLQEAAGAQCREIGLGEEVMRRLGVMWAVIRYRVDVERWPRAGETVTVETWPGVTRHNMCPRFYRFLDGEGKILLRGTALWVVMDRETRRMAAPAERGVEIEPLVTGDEPPLPAPVRRPVTDQEASFVVPAEYLDSNGHMNNTTYFDLAERYIGRDARRDGLRAVSAEYLNEALCGEEIRVLWGFDGARCTVVGESGGNHVFRMLLQYGE